MEDLRIIFVVFTIILTIAGFFAWVEYDDVGCIVWGILIVPIMTIFIKILIFVSQVLI